MHTESLKFERKSAGKVFFLTFGFAAFLFILGLWAPYIEGIGHYLAQMSRTIFIFGIIYLICIIFITKKEFPKYFKSEVWPSVKFVSPLLSLFLMGFLEPEIAVYTFIGLMWLLVLNLIGVFIIYIRNPIPLSFEKKKIRILNLELNRENFGGWKTKGNNLIFKVHFPKEKSVGLLMKLVARKKKQAVLPNHNFLEIFVSSSFLLEKPEIIDQKIKSYLQENPVEARPVEPLQFNASNDQ